MTAATADAATVLDWPAANRGFNITLKRDRFGRDYKHFQANRDGHEYVLPEDFNGLRDYYLYKKKDAFTMPDGVAAAQYDCTVQIYAVMPPT